MLTKMCKKCGAIIPYPLTYCDKCTRPKAERAASDKHYNKYKRNKRNDAFYHSKEWKALSAYVLIVNDYKCTECGGIATEVHHIVEVNDDWNKRLDIKNLKPLCTGCHNKCR